MTAELRRQIQACFDAAQAHLGLPVGDDALGDEAPEQPA
jgi:hypothetical protein